MRCVAPAAKTIQVKRHPVRRKEEEKKEKLGSLFENCIFADPLNLLSFFSFPFLFPSAEAVRHSFFFVARCSKCIAPFACMHPDQLSEKDLCFVGVCNFLLFGKLGASRFLSLKDALVCFPFLSASQKGGRQPDYHLPNGRIWRQTCGERNAT